MAARPDVDDSTCPRCGRAFHCGVADGEPCWCRRVVASVETLARLRRLYDRCVCSACLTEIDERPEQIP